MGVLDYDQTPGNNTSINGIAIQGTSNVQNFDNALRQYMADMAAYVTRRTTKAANYTAVKADNHQLIEFTAAATLSLTAAATLGDGWSCIVRANGGDVLIDPNSTETINGAATLTLKDSNATVVFCNGSAFFTLGTILPNDANAARSNLSAQAYNDKLQNLSNTTGGADRLPYFNGTDSWAEVTFTAFARTLLDDTDAATARTTLGAQSALGYTAANKAGETFTGSNEIRTGTAFTQTIMEGFGWSSGFTAWRVVLSGATEWQLWAYNASSGATLGQRLSLNQSGDLSIVGSISKGSGTFLIDHPLDPANKDLAHGFVEAPRYDLIYRGTVALVDGRATVDIDAASDMSPGTFAALTTNAVVASLQNQSGFAAVRPAPIAGGSFDIVSVDPTSSDTVAWVVIAERNDAFVKHMDDNCDAEGRFIPEREKPE